MNLGENGLGENKENMQNLEKGLQNLTLNSLNLSLIGNNLGENSETINIVSEILEN